MINLITGISVIGITVITAALVILLSAFNGIEKMIEQLFSDFDSNLTIRVKEGKTFHEDRIKWDDLNAVSGIERISRAIEETVVLKHEQKWINAQLTGVDTSFLKMSSMSGHMVDGDAQLENGNVKYGIIGASLLDKLEGFIPKEVGYETIFIYAPKRNIKMTLGKSPFNSRLIKLSGRFNYNKEVNEKSLVVPIDMARELFQYDKQLSAIYLNIRKDEVVENIKEELKKIVGNDFVVKTSYEKNELIYKTSKSEKIIVLFILLFIFILAAFNLVASLTMLFVEKMENLRTMLAFGANKKFLFNIFFIEGLLISGTGIVFGFIIGYGICFAQLKFKLIEMPNSGGEIFPIDVTLSDGLMILFLVSVLSFIFSYLPVKYLIKKNLSV